MDDDDGNARYVENNIFFPKFKHKKPSIGGVYQELLNMTGLTDPIETNMTHIL